MSAADHWNDHYKQGKGFRPVAEPEVDLLAEHLGPGNGRRALDVGCGTGEYSAALHDLGFQVTGVDFSEVAVATAQDRQGERDGLDFRLLDADRGGLGLLPAGEFDLITCRLFLPFVDLVPTVACARRLLVPGGRLLVTTPVASAGAPAGSRSVCWGGPERGRPLPPSHQQTTDRRRSDAHQSVRASGRTRIGRRS
ncbi:class I SAM-dependent methyltransferase [Kitasatospora sp. NBC_00085]|uniref:class I SAM-dependent methyltransferase n=1 Tax=unclassified Kitasatospora TaxID=2633591 RepID=UPI00324BD0C9